MSELDELRAFVRAAETGGFTAAARSLGVTQTVISRRIKALEERLGVTLFHRTTRAVALTPDGEVLVGYLTGAAIDPQPADGVAAGADPLSLTADPAVVTVGGAAATTLFSGATPGFVGLIQVNFQLPAELPPGRRLTLVIEFGDAATLPLSLPVSP